jgi:dihydroneopterin aldolase
MSGSNVTPLPIASAALAIRHVFIRNLELLAHIGVHGHEQGKMQPVRINVDLAVEDSAVLAAARGTGRRLTLSEKSARY